MTYRSTTLQNLIWAEGAITEIPLEPVPGIIYRNTTTFGSGMAGWAYQLPVDSATYNEVLYMVSAVSTLIEQTGILAYSNLINYPVGGRCVGNTDLRIYRCLIANGPSTVVKPCDNGANPTYWYDESAGLTYVTRSALNNVNFTLPQITNTNRGRVATIISANAGTSIYITPYAGDNIMGTSGSMQAQSTTAYKSISFMPDTTGNTWIITGGVHTWKDSVSFPGGLTAVSVNFPS